MSTPLSQKVFGENTPITLSLVLTLFGVGIGIVKVHTDAQTQLATVQTKLDDHLHDPNFHSALAKELRRDYMTKDELNRQFASIETDLKEIKDLLRSMQR